MSGWDVVGSDKDGSLSVVVDPPPKGFNILPGSGGPYPTKAQADAALKALQGVIATPEPLIPGTNIQAPHLPNPLSGIAAVGDFFQRLTQANTWIRIGEVIIGVLLVAVGVAKLSGVSPGSLAKVAAL